jgi:hypothetical protein
MGTTSVSVGQTRSRTSALIGTIRGASPVSIHHPTLPGIHGPSSCSATSASSQIGDLQQRSQIFSAYLRDF